MKIFNMIMTKKLSRSMLNIFFLVSVVLLTVSAKGIFDCGGGGGGGEPPPPVPILFFGVEVDKMTDSDDPYLSDIFNGEFKRAKTNGTLSAYYDEQSIPTQEWLDQRNYEVTNFIDSHRNQDFSTYNGECYICCVQKMYSSGGDVVAGLSFFSEDTSIHREAKCAIATLHIREMWMNQNPQPTDQLNWFFAWISAHELGHCFTIAHCSVSGCILEKDVGIRDEVPRTYCSNCLQTIRTNWP